MAQPALKYYVTSEWPERVEELRSNISTAADGPALLAAAYAAGLPTGADFWAAASIDYPSATIWFHTREPLAGELLEQQAAELNRQVGLVRSDEAQLPVMSFRPEPMATAVEADAPPLTEALAHYRDFIVFSAAQPQALVRAGSLGPDSTPDYQQIAPLAELVGLNLAAIQRQSGSLETAQLITSRQEWSEEQFFDLLERALYRCSRCKWKLSVQAAHWPRPSNRGCRSGTSYATTCVLLILCASCNLATTSLLCSARVLVRRWWQPTGCGPGSEC